MTGVQTCALPICTITGLSASTIYHVRAYATNASGTYYGDDLTFQSVCGTISIFPWNEGFENAGVIPNCWTQEQVNSSGLNWTFVTGNGSSYPATAHSGTYNACLKDLTAATNITRLVTPSLNLTGVQSPSLSFWHTQIAWSGRQDVLEVYYKTSAGGTWTLLASYTTAVASWTQHTITLPNPSADYYLAFQGNAVYGRGICIDDIQVASSCVAILPVGVSVAAAANPVCDGTAASFTATPVNGGTTPAYQWKVNGTNTGTNSAAYSYTPANTDVVTCVLTSNATCISGNPATSNAITMATTPIVPVSVSIAASANPVDPGVSVTFTASPTNGGTTPAYQWKVNSANAGTNSSQFTYTPVNGDIVTCVLTSGLSCTSSNPATSNAITMTVNSISVITEIQNTDVTGTQCFNATQTINVAGNGNYFTVHSGGIATMIAGVNILFNPGTVVEPGGYLYGYIAPSGPWCGAFAMPATVNGTEETPQKTDQQFYRIYPNPTKGELTLELNEPGTSDKYLAEIYDMKGERLFSSQLTNQQTYDFSLTGFPAGIYLVRVIGEKNSGTTRIIKN